MPIRDLKWNSPSWPLRRLEGCQRATSELPSYVFPQHKLFATFYNFSPPRSIFSSSAVARVSLCDLSSSNQNPITPFVFSKSFSSLSRHANLPFHRFTKSKSLSSIKGEPQIDHLHHQYHTPCHQHQNLFLEFP